MPLFQKSVLQKQLTQIENSLKLKEAWQRYAAYFLDEKTQQNIRAAKEEQFQEGFLKALFVEVLGYTLNPSPNFNLTTEQKNIRDGRKADGAILKNNEVWGVIELKSTQTRNLQGIEDQAFLYKSNHKNCKYVITSNFEKLRFYIGNAVDFEEFNLFTLSEARFRVLWVCLAAPFLLQDLPESLNKDSLRHDEEITRKLYHDFSEARYALFESILQKNAAYDPLTLFRATQKILDRLLFMLFAEDRFLIPPNTVRKTLEDWVTLREKYFEDTSLYHRFKKFFYYIDKGFRKPNLKVFPYNGGLFAKDEFLDKLELEDKVLYHHAYQLSAYDFNSEVSVNVLGHIFEHSLTEIEEVQAKLAGNVLDYRQSKRKKDGVFYTPQYITRYILQQTLGKLFTEKKEALSLCEEDIPQEITALKKTEKEALQEKIRSYREWLQNLTVCDPACGSGAFLIEALRFLEEEHQHLDELENQFGNTEKEKNTAHEQFILENNLYGVDINEESVEITQLSLWLHTAQEGRKLTTLSHRIKCGNSIVHTAELAGEKAFVWQEAFPEVFQRGGFDVIIGNPPYGAKLEKEVQQFLNSHYLKGGSETVISFMALAHRELLRPNGKFGFIIPKSFSYASNYGPLRDLLHDELSEMVDCQKVWKEVKLEQVMVFFTKDKSEKAYASKVLEDEKVIPKGEIEKEKARPFGFFLNQISPRELDIALQMRESGVFLNDIAHNTRGGMFQRQVQQDRLLPLCVLGGANIQREGIFGQKGYIAPETIAHDSKALVQPHALLVQNIIAHILNPSPHLKITACFPHQAEKYAILDTINQLVFSTEKEAKTHWLLLNSSLLGDYAYRFVFGRAIRTMHFDLPVTSSLPVPEKLAENKALLQTADALLGVYAAMRQGHFSFSKTLQALGLPAELPRRLRNWPELLPKDFFEKLKKEGVNIPKKEYSEWVAFFEESKHKAEKQTRQAEALQEEAEKLICAAYGLGNEVVHF